MLDTKENRPDHLVVLLYLKLEYFELINVIDPNYNIYFSKSFILSNIYLVSTLDQPSVHFPVRAHHLYFGHLMRLARPRHFLKYRNDYCVNALRFSKTNMA